MLNLPTRMYLTGETTWRFGINENNGFNQESFLEKLMTICGYTKSDKGYTKSYNIFTTCCTTCQENLMIAHLSFEDTFFLRADCQIPYAYFESHPRREAENAMKKSWDILLADLLLAGVCFDDDVPYEEANKKLYAKKNVRK